MKSPLATVRSFLHSNRRLTHIRIRGLAIRVREAAAYILAFTLGLVAVGVFLYWHIASGYQHEIASCRTRVSNTADDRAQRIADWLREREEDAQVLATHSSVRAVLRTYDGTGQIPKHSPDSLLKLTAVLDKLASLYPYAGVYALDRDAQLVAQSSRSAPLDPLFSEICRAVARSGATRIGLVGEASQRSLVGFAVPVLPEPGTANADRPKGQLLGTVLVVSDASQTLFPLVAREGVPTRTGETVLVRREGDTIIFFSPLRQIRAGSPNLRFPLSTGPAAAQLAVEGRETFVEYTDYRGARVLAATRRIPSTGWGLVCKIDRAEAMEDFRRMAIAEAIAGGLFVILLGGLLLFLRRHVITRVLKREEEKFRALLESAPDAIYIFDSSTLRILRRNRVATELDGYSDEDIAHMTAADLHAPEEQTLLREWIERGPEARGVLHLHTLRRKDGKFVPVEVNRTLVDTGGERYILSILRDITERKRAEAALRESEEHFRSLFENMLNGFAFCRMHYEQNQPQDFTYLNVNNAFEVLTGLKDVVGRRVSEVIPGIREADPELFGMYGRVALTGTPERIETYVAALGMWFSIAVYSPKKEYFVAVFDVITERKRAEEALTKERYLLHTLMDNLPDMIYFKDREGQFSRINLALANEYGLSHPGQAIGKTDFDFHTAERAQGAYNDEQEIIRTGQPVVDKEEKTIWPDGRVGWVSTTKMPLRDPNGDIIGTFGISRDVTQHKRAEDALVESEEKYRSLVSNIPDVVWTVDDELRFTFISKNVVKLCGYSLEEVYQGGTNLLLASLHPDDVHEIREGFRGLITKGQPFDVECRLQRKGGEWIWVHDRAISTFEKNGIRYATGLLSDITERKRAEEQARLQTAALESAANGIVIANLEGNIIWVNPAFTRLTGYPAAEVMGKNPRLWKSGVHDKVFYQDLWDTILSGEVWQGEIVNRRKDGASYIEEMTITPVRDTQGTISHFIAIKQDITARKRAEESMRESEERFRATFENAGIGVALVDLQGCPIKTNPALRQMLGYSMEELSHMAFTEFTHPDDRELDWALFTDLVAGKREKYEIEKRFVRKDGGLVWGLLTVSLVKGGDGRPVRAVGMVQDITERKRADEELRLTQFSLDCASDGVFWMDSQGRIIRVNEAACRSLGRSHEELLSLSIPDIDPLLPKEAWGPFWEKIKTCGSIAFETQHQTKRGKIFPVEVTSNYLEFDGKEYAFAFSHDITERKRAGEELYQSRQMLQTILDTIPQRVFWKNRDISYLGCNQAFAVDAGLKDPAEIVGKNDYELAWKETAERYRADDKSVMEDAAPRLNFDEPQNRPDGSLMWLRTNKLPLHDQGGKVIGILGTYEDITERKRATARLAAQARIAEIFLSVSDCDIYQEILKLILDNLHSSLGLFGFIDEDGGLEVPSMTREIWHTCLMPGKTTRFPRNTWGESSWARALKEKRTIYSNELSASTPQGHIHVCRHIALPILFHGEAIGLFVVANKETDYTKDDVQTLENIAHHVAPILSARLQRQRAEGTRDYLASIVEYSDDAIFGTSVEGIIRSWNAGAEKLYGYTTAEVVGQSVFCLAPPDRRKEMEGFLNQLNQGKKIEPQETVRVRKNGGLVDVSVTISPLKNASGEVTGASTVARDITARRGIERMKDELVSVVSHELRTPLTSIRGALGLLAGGLLRSQPEKGNRMLEIAVTNTDRLVRLINDVLDLERMDSGKMKMEKQTCNAADLMTQSVDSVRDLADKAGVTLSVSPYSARIWIDPDRIIQALINLLSNAIKFSTRGGTIWLSATPQADQLLFQVKDQGRGIPQDMLESIFERFQQVDASDRRDKGGTGLGLPITRKIVQQHDGRIWVESALGQGSTFSFTIPLLQAETILVGDGSGTRKVLVCTVETDILSAVQAVLNQRGYTVLASPTWQEAIKMASSESPDAILVDWSLPGMEDMETMASWKQKSPTRDIPVIGLGGTAPDEVHLTSMGLAGWVAKPLNEASLLLALGSVLGKPGEGPRVLVVEDDADLARVLMTIFERHGAVVLHARTGREAARVCPQFIPDLLVLDVMLPELDGFGVVEKLRQHKHLQHLPLAVYSVRELDDSEKARLRLGESIFMTKSRLTPQEFEQRAIGLLNWATSGQRERRRQ